MVRLLKTAQSLQRVFVCFYALVTVELSDIDTIQGGFDGSQDGQCQVPAPKRFL